MQEPAQFCSPSLQSGPQQFVVVQGLVEVLQAKLLKSARWKGESLAPEDKVHLNFKTASSSHLDKTFHV